MFVYCPKCHAAISAAQMNVATDVAVCSACNEAYPLSSIVNEDDVSRVFHLYNPPKGVLFDENAHGWSITATTRSSHAFFLIPFMCIWSGLTVDGTYGSQIVKGKFDLFPSLLGIPFLLGTIFLGGTALMYVCGKVVVNVEGRLGTVFTGVGPLGRTRKFDWAAVESIEEDFITSSRKRGYERGIALVGKTRMTFGSMLSDSRSYYLLQALRLLKKRRN